MNLNLVLAYSRTIFLLLLSTLVLAVLSRSVIAEEELPTKAVQEFVTVLEQIKRNYVFEQSDEVLIESAIRGMVSSLDPYSRYLNAEELAQFQRASSSTTGSPIWSLSEKQGGYVYLDIDFFQLTIADYIKRDLSKVNKFTGVVIDLRDNGGGFVDSAVAVADLFLDNKLVVNAKGRSAEANRDLRTNRLTPFINVPMVILINENTASAAEIFAAAMQDHERATIIGTSSYGKGTVQSLIYTNFGAIQITTSMNYRPLGTAIQGEGVVPNYDVASKDSLEQFISVSPVNETLYNLIIKQLLLAEATEQ